MTPSSQMLTSFDKRASPRDIPYRPPPNLWLTARVHVHWTHGHRYFLWENMIYIIPSVWNNTLFVDKQWAVPSPRPPWLCLNRNKGVFRGALNKPIRVRLWSWGLVVSPKQWTSSNTGNRIVVGRWFGPSTDSKAGMYQRIKPLIVLKANSSLLRGNQDAFFFRFLLECWSPCFSSLLHTMNFTLTVLPHPGSGQPLSY